MAAEKAGALLVPMGSAIASGTVFRRAWDHFALAWPFSRVAVVLGAPCAPEVLGRAIEAANGRAQILARDPLELYDSRQVLGSADAMPQRVPPD